VAVEAPTGSDNYWWWLFALLALIFLVVGFVVGRSYRNVLNSTSAQTPADPKKNNSPLSISAAVSTEKNNVEKSTSKDEVPVGTFHADKAVEKKTATRKFVSFTSPDEHGPSKVSWHGVEVHSLHIEPDGTKSIRFTEN